MVTADPSYAGMSADECLRLVVDYAWEVANQGNADKLIKRAHLRLPEADISNIDYEGRELSRDLVLRLGTSQFVEAPTDVVLQGFAGSGKSHLACALAKQACKHGIRTLYTRMPGMLDYLRRSARPAGRSAGSSVTMPATACSSWTTSCCRRRTRSRHTS